MTKFAYAAAIALVAAAVFGRTWLLPLDDGLPNRDRLEAVSGRLIAHHWGARSFTIRMELQGQSKIFDYTEKMGDNSNVWHALCDGCITTLWVDPADSRPEPFAFQIAVKGRVVRRYSDVKNTWVSDNRDAPYAAIIFFAAFLCFASYAAYQWRRLRKMKMN